MASLSTKAFENDQVPISSLPKAEEVHYDGLSPKHLWKTNITTTISLGFFIGIATGVYLFFPESYNGLFPVLLVFLLLIFGWSYYSNWQWQRRSGYALREKDIIFKRGFLFEKITVVPFNRIQHVSTQRGVLDKMLGISTLQVFTAGGSGSDISIPGLTPELAFSLKEALASSIDHHV